MHLALFTERSFSCAGSREVVKANYRESHWDNLNLNEVVKSEKVSRKSWVELLLSGYKNLGLQQSNCGGVEKDKKSWNFGGLEEKEKALFFKKGFTEINFRIGYLNGDDVKTLNRVEVEKVCSFNIDWRNDMKTDKSVGRKESGHFKLKKGWKINLATSFMNYPFLKVFFKTFLSSTNRNSFLIIQNWIISKIL